MKNLDKNNFNPKKNLHNTGAWLISGKDPETYAQTYMNKKILSVFLWEKNT